MASNHHDSGELIEITPPDSVRTCVFLAQDFTDKRLKTQRHRRVRAPPGDFTQVLAFCSHL